MIVFKYALLRNLRSSFSLFASCIVPVIFIFIYPEMWIYAPEAGVSMIAYLMLLSSYLLVGIILEDQIDGSIIKILASPVSTFSYIVQNLLASILPLLLQITILVIVGQVRYNWKTEFTFGVAVSLLLFAIANIAFAFCWNMFFKSKETSKYTFIFVVISISLLSGMVVPIEALPVFLQNMGAVSHPYWLMRSINSLTLNGLNLEFWLFQIILILFAAAFLILGGKRRTI